MAIGYVNGGIIGSSSAVIQKILTYSPTAGNTMCIFLGFSTNTMTSITVQDNAGTPNLLTAGTHAQNTVYVVPFYYTAVAGITTFTANWTGAAQCNMIGVEYSGVGTVNAGLAGNTNTGTSTTPSITVTTEDNNDWIVAAICGNAVTPVITTGNSRQTEVGGNGRLVGGDNTVATAGSVTVGGTLAGGPKWAAALLELKVPSVGAGGFSPRWVSV